MATTIAWLPQASARARTSSGSRTAAVLIETLSAPGAEQQLNVVGRRNAPSHGERREHHVGRPGDHVEHGGALLVRGGDVEERDLVGPLASRSGWRTRRIARVAQAHEVHPFDDAAVLDVEAGDDALCEHELR